MDSARLVVLTVWLPKPTLAADQVALGPEVSPTPSKETECGLPTVLSVIVIEAVLWPNWLGVKVTLIVHAAPAARLDPHELFWLKSAALVPESETLAIATADVPVLERVSAWAPLADPISCGPKLRPDGERVRVSGS